MTDLTSRLRDVIGSGRPPAATSAGVARGDADRVLGGTFVERDTGRCLVIDRVRRPSHCHGDVRLDALSGRPGCCASVARLLGDGSAVDGQSGSLVFIDIETTGLAGGAGTHAFLVGFGWFDGEAFCTRQLFLDQFRDEAALLELTASELQRASAIASFNGRTFDVPLMDTRYLFHRRTPPSTGKPHLDLLPPARRLWRGPDGCSLSVLERQLFGVSREIDVPGIDIPGRYFAYIRGGGAEALEPVLEHNRSDLLSLALIALHIGRLIEDGANATRTGEECLGLGQIYEGIGERLRAAACYERALRLTWRAADRRLEALRALARVCRRDRRHEDARSAWEEIVEHGSGGALRIEAVTALAVHHEHRSRDLPRAKRFATLALEAESRLRRAAAEYRLARIERKLQCPQQRFAF
jgi:uncharacterized protein YprB with RNaseH-like and TPR domain